MTSFSSVQNRGSDDDSGIINLQCLLFLGGWGGVVGSTENCCVIFFFFEQENKGSMDGGLIGVSYRGAPGFRHWNVLGNKPGGNMRFARWRKTKALLKYEPVNGREAQQWPSPRAKHKQQCSSVQIEHNAEKWCQCAARQSAILPPWSLFHVECKLLKR